MISFKNGKLELGLYLWLPAFIRRRLTRGREAWLASGQSVGREKRWYDGLIALAWRIDPPP
jgi:hypothetical protein